VRWRRREVLDRTAGVARILWRENQGEKQRLRAKEDAMESLFVAFLFDVA
jgi:hypothetical protein